VKKKQISKINNYYNNLLKCHGVKPHALGCPKGRQSIRFKNIDNLIFKNCNILDFGCGFADLLNYLNKNHSSYKFKYTGCDIVSNFIEISRNKYSRSKFIDLNSDSINHKYDIVTAFGVFNLKYTKSDKDHFQIVKNELSKLYNISNKYLLVDFQSPFVDYKQKDSYHPNLDPLIEFIVKSLSRRFEIIHSYLPYEFSILISKDNHVTKNNQFKPK
jgi:SAM-dependent methyltransferase